MADPERRQQLNEAADAARRAREQLLRADDAYATAGTGDLVIERLGPYFDPARRRAKVISDYAHALSVDVAAFDGARAGLLERAALLSMGLEQVVVAIEQAILGEAIRGMPGVGRPGGTGEEAAAIEQRMALLVDLGVCIGNEYAWALRLTKTLIELRQASLESYVKEVPQLNARTLFGQFVEVAAEEGMWVIGEELLRDVVIHSTPVGAIIGGTLQVAQRLREKARAMEAHYEASPLDQMFELAEETGQENELILEIGSFLDATVDSFNELTRSVNDLPVGLPR